MVIEPYGYKATLGVETFALAGTDAPVLTLKGNLLMLSGSMTLGAKQTLTVTSTCTPDVAGTPEPPGPTAISVFSTLPGPVPLPSQVGELTTDDPQSPTAEYIRIYFKLSTELIPWLPVTTIEAMFNDVSLAEYPYGYNWGLGAPSTMDVPALGLCSQVGGNGFVGEATLKFVARVAGANNEPAPAAASIQLDCRWIADAGTASNIADADTSPGGNGAWPGHAATSSAESGCAVVSSEPALEVYIAALILGLGILCARRTRPSKT
ncbi:MAG: hypothetical protein HY898_28690 [Deltaproteobacteria bacterium]|nr:hypothetical protein [Deltaproteobacteria bacterium]